MAVRQSRIGISAQLDRNYEKFKEVALLHLLKLVPGGLEPVVCPVALNLLPTGSSAEVAAPLTSEVGHFGIIKIALALHLDQQTKTVDVFALFHIEDVYDMDGMRLVEKSPEATVTDLKANPVDIVARSIAAHESYSGLLQLANKITSENADTRLPILQAVIVFLRSPRDSSQKLVVGGAPLPTFFRREPTSLNRKQAATAFYFNLTLRSRLDKKVFEFLDTCSNHTTTVAQKMLSPVFTRQSLASHFRKVSPRIAVKRLAVIDVNSLHLQLNFGMLPHVLDLGNRLAPESLPATVKVCPARVKLIWLDRPVPKYGLVEFNPPGAAVPVTALFSSSSVAAPLVGGDLSGRFWCNMPGIRVNAMLADARHRIPYMVSSIWQVGQEPTDREAASEHRLKQEWKTAADQILADRESLNFIVGSIVQAKELAEAEQKRQQDLAETSTVSGSEGMETEESAASKAPWRKSIRNRIGIVDRVVNNNFALAVDYQENPGHRDRRYYILFDTCDIWIDGQVAQSRQKKMPEIVNEGDRILFNAVHIDVENTWNLNYMATAVVAIKGAGGWVDMPPGALFIDSAADVKVDKLNNFKLVAAKLTKKPPPEDRRPQRSGPMGGGRGRGGPHRGRGMAHGHSFNRYDSAVTSMGSGPERWADRKASENSQATTARRRVIMSDMPELYKELKPMEIYRQGTFIYDCKACGIQGMSIEDAEDHVGQASHKEAVDQEKNSVQMQNRFQDRGDAEEALFLNANKSIKVIERNGRKFYNCQDCKAMNMMYINAKKHVASLAHKKNDRSLKESSMLDQECKEMRKRLERDGVVYHCTPCFFQTDSIIKNKEHLTTEEHKRLTTLYCHVCKEFSQNKAALEDHRFSIRHRRSCDELDLACLQAMSVKKSDKTKKKPDKNKEEEEKEAESQPAEVPENFNCKFCNFEGTDKESYDEHVATASHKRRVFIETQEMPSGGLDAFSSSGGRCNTIEEMCLIREGKDINEQVAKSKTLRDSDEIKKAKESLINKLFDHGVFTQLAVKTNVRCNTCRCQLSGKEKMLTQQLIMHLTGEKHTSKLRLQIKAEEHTGVDRNTAQELEEQEREAAEAAAEETEAPAAAALAVPSLDAALEEISAWLSEQTCVVSITSQLFCCDDCKTGLKLARDLLKHMKSEAHKAGVTEERDWRRYIEWCDVYEHGENIFKVNKHILIIVGIIQQFKIVAVLLD
jgi:ferredoxin